MSNDPLQESSAPTLFRNPRLRPLFLAHAQLAAVLPRLISSIKPDNESPYLSSAQKVVVFAAVKANQTQTALRQLSLLGLGQDALVLVRSLFELGISARYVSMAPSSERAERWLDYDWVNRYQFYQLVKYDDYFKSYHEIANNDAGLSTEIETQARRVQDKWHFGNKRGTTDHLLSLDTGLVCQSGRSLKMLDGSTIMTQCMH